MGMNKSKNKTSIFKREGFYVVLFLCLCAVAIVTVYISKTNSLKKESEIAKNQKVNVEEKLQDAQQVKKPNENATVPTMKRGVKEEDKKKSEDKKEDAEKAKDASAKKTTAKTISLTIPVEGKVTKKFSKDELQYTTSLDLWETHEAIDIACTLGTEVKVAAKGKVIDVFNDDKAEKTLKSGQGVTVIVEHEGGYRTVYSNLAENLKVKKGDSVEAGAAIGVVGDTSVREAIKDDGSHLHFGLLKKNGKDYETVDPTTYIKK